MADGDERREGAVEAPVIPVDEASLCPSCGRFVGPKARCPFCGAGIQTRISVRLFKWGAVALAVLGLFFLYLWAVHRDLSRVKVGEIVETMNMAYVEVQGEVGKVSPIRDEKGRLEYLSFEVDDGTGVARFKAYRHAAMSLESRDLLPRRGDKITAAGSVRIGEEGRVSLYLQTAEHVKLERKEAKRVSLNALDFDRIGEIVRVEGRVTRIYAPEAESRVPYKVRLEEEGATGYLVVWQRMWPGLEARGVKTGAVVAARVTVGEYGGKIQLLLESAEDLSVEGTSPAAPAPKPPQDVPGLLAPGDVDPSMKGSRLRVRGEVLDVVPPPPGSARPGVVKLAGTRAELVAWGEAFEGLLERGVEKGRILTARVKVDVYQGRLQLKLAGLRGVRVEGSEGPADGPGPGFETVTRGRVGESATIRGEVADMKTYRTGTLLAVRSGSSTVQSFLRAEILDRAEEAAGLGPGATVEIRGTIETYEGRLQVNPGDPAGIRVLEASPEAPREPAAPAKRRASSLKRSDEGRFVILVGTVASLEPIRKKDEVLGTRIVLDDGSGKTAEVVVWDAVKQGMEEPGDLAVGRTLQVVGKVQLYHKKIQVVPENGWDVLAVD